MSTRRSVVLASLCLSAVGCSREAPEPLTARPLPVAKATERLSARALVGHAEVALGQGDDAGAVALLERAVVAEPANRRALALLIEAAMILGDGKARAGDAKAAGVNVRRAAGAARDLLQAHPDLEPNERSLVGFARYREAGVLAAEGAIGPAIEALRGAVAVGFRNADAFRNDPALAPLRGRPEFAAILADISRQTRERIAGLLAANAPFPFQFNLPDVDGKVLGTDDLKGRVAIVDIWGTWCPPCRMEIPHLVDLSRRYADRGLRVVGINYEQMPEDQARETVRSFAKAQDVSYPCLMGDEATQKAIPDFGGFPTTLFLDRTGAVRLKLVGYTEKAELEAIVEALLDEPAPAAPAGD